MKKIVGASSMYVRGPFVVNAALYGISGALITMAIFYPITLWLGPKAAQFFGGFDLFRYYLAHFFEIFFLLLGAGIGLGVISSAVAIRRYLKV